MAPSGRRYMASYRGSPTSSPCQRREHYFSSRGGRDDFLRRRFWPVGRIIAGLVGNILGDAISGFGFWWHWDVGNGIMGLIPAWPC